MLTVIQGHNKLTRYSTTITRHDIHKYHATMHRVPTLLEEKNPGVFQSNFRIFQVPVIKNCAVNCPGGVQGTAPAAKWFYHILSIQMLSPDTSPLNSARQHPSYGDCLEVKREYYQNYSVLGCVTQCSQSAAHSYEQFLQV